MSQAVNYKWVKHDPEWIKNNPGKPTMYKIPLGNTTIPINPETDEVDVYCVEDIAPGVFKGTAIQGIYYIECVPEKYVYVGQSKNVGVRLRNHKMNMHTDSSTNNSVYRLMKEHIKKHGIGAFGFNIVDTTNNLLVSEYEIMLEFLERGYSLYNNIFSIRRDWEMVHCPKKYKDVINSLIRELSMGRVVPDQLLKIINNQSG